MLVHSPKISTTVQNNSTDPFTAFTAFCISDFNSSLLLTISVQVELLLCSLLLQVQLPSLPILLQAEPTQPWKAKDGVNGVPLDLGLTQLLLLHLPTRVLAAGQVDGEGRWWTGGVLHAAVAHPTDPTDLLLPKLGKQREGLRIRPAAGIACLPSMRIIASNCLSCWRPLPPCSHPWHRARHPILGASASNRQAAANRDPSRVV